MPSSIVGLPGYPVEDVTLENIEISFGGKASKEIAYIPLDKITSVPENPANYPEFSMFGELPSWGFYVRHASGIKMKNVKVSYVAADFRPAFVFDDVKGIAMTTLRPSGKINIEGKTYDALAESGMIDKGTAIVVIRVETAQLYVEEI